MFAKLLKATLLFTFILIVVGAATRVFEAGMSCPDWPMCYGQLVPFPESVVPGGYVVDGRHYTTFQVMLEYGHRSLAALVGLGLLGLLLYLPGRPLRVWLALGTAFVLLALQIKLGAITVWMGNIHWSVAAHLGTAMLFIGALAWARRAHTASEFPIIPAPKWALPLALFVALLVWSTMVVGAFVSSSFSGGVCGGLFSCDGQWFPADMQQLWHMKHRYLALTTLLAVGVYGWLCQRHFPFNLPSAKALAIMVGIQVALGIFTLYSFSHYPSGYHALSILHLAWGTVVWLVAVGNALNLTFGRQGRFHG